MDEIAIKVKSLSKAYRVGFKELKHDTLGGTLISWIKSPLNNFKRLKGLTNISSTSIDSDLFWALKDVSFEVKRGEIVGIIGKNGAGKSTLLKILSQIVEPTAGKIEINGRIASLLEVGTGFNPELTGRENIYLNGTILGMTRKEISKKFNEIVDFSGVEKFIDTPVKRYSSGMKVRLAFAVAAHLEPEILIIDEILAVGDLEFQKKCLGKIDEVAKCGRTVLFVSHNMAAIQGLCTRCIMFKDGQIKSIGPVKKIISLYNNENQNFNVDRYSRQGTGDVVFQNFQLLDNKGNKKSVFFIGEPLKLYFELHYKIRNNQSLIGIDIVDGFDEYYAHIINLDDEFIISNISENEIIKVEVDLGQITLAPSDYYLSLWVGDTFQAFDFLEKCLSFSTIQDTNYIKRNQIYKPNAKVVIKSVWRKIN